MGKRLEFMEIGSKGTVVVSPALGPSVSFIGDSPPVLKRCGSLKSSCGRVIGAKGNPLVSKIWVISFADYFASLSFKSTIRVGLFFTLSLLVSRCFEFFKSSKPNCSQNTLH